MKTFLFAGVCALAAVALSGCAGFSIPGTAGPDPTALLHEINSNLANCDRQIQGTTGPVPTASFNITCRAQPVVAPPVQFGPAISTLNGSIPVGGAPQ